MSLRKKDHDYNHKTMNNGPNLVNRITPFLSPISWPYPISPLGPRHQARLGQQLGSPSPFPTCKVETSLVTKEQKKLKGTLTMRKETTSL